MSMEPAKEQPSETRPPAGGPGGDFRRLKTEGAATVAELREFLGQMRGKSPQEVLGLVAKSGLTRGIVLATLLFLVLLVALTVGPYLLAERGADASAPVAGQTTAPEGDAAAPAEPNSAKQPGPEAAAASDLTAAEAGAPPGTDRAIDAMGIGETRVADPDESPLEDKIDGLLDGIE